jgi:hypothetical protein
MQSFQIPKIAAHESPQLNISVMQVERSVVKQVNYACQKFGQREIALVRRFCTA